MGLQMHTSHMLSSTNRGAKYEDILSLEVGDTGMEAEADSSK